MSIFWRSATKKEGNSPTAKRRAYADMPDKLGYTKVYMPYGTEGRGFYYIKIDKEDNIQ